MLAVLASFTFEHIVRLTKPISIESQRVKMTTYLTESRFVDEELPQIVDSVMSFNRFVLVHDARRQILLVSLTLEDCATFNQ